MRSPLPDMKEVRAARWSVNTQVHEYTRTLVANYGPQQQFRGSVNTSPVRCEAERSRFCSACLRFELVTLFGRRKLLKPIGDVDCLRLYRFDQRSASFVISDRGILGLDQALSSGVVLVLCRIHVVALAWPLQMHPSSLFKRKKRSRQHLHVRGGRSHLLRLRLCSCSKIFESESGSGKFTNLRIRLLSKFELTSIQPKFTHVFNQETTTQTPATVEIENWLRIWVRFFTK